MCALFLFLYPAPAELFTLSLHDALPICSTCGALSRATATTVTYTGPVAIPNPASVTLTATSRSEEHTSELQSLRHLVCRLLLEKKKRKAQARLPSRDPGGSRDAL